MFKGKVALVTGAAGGIGAALVNTLAAKGATIVAADREPETLEALRQITGRNKTGLFTVPGDLRDPDYCDSLPITAIKQAGKLDIVVNNAGIITRGNVLETSDADWANSMTINVESVFRICRSAIGAMRKSGGGAIVNIASCWGLYPGPDHAAYCTSKAAVAALSKCMGRDHAHEGIRVNAVCPNEVNTPMLRSGFARRGFNPDSAVEELGKTVPIGRIAEAADIADTVAFLVSEQAGYITGATLEVNGGKPVF